MNRTWTRRRWMAALPGLAAAGRSAAAGAEGESGTPIEWPAELQTVDGVVLDRAHWQGVPGVVVFWATWCAFCRRHNAHLDKLHRSLAGRRLNILGVAMDKDAATVRSYLASAGHGFPVVLDAGRLRQGFTDRRVIPMTCTFDRQGRVLQRIPGEMAEADLLDLARLALPALR